MKMSPIEITNRISDAERTGPTLSMLLMTQAAIEDWTQKYPQDNWIPEREYRLALLFAEMGTEQAHAMATWCHTFLQQHFPNDPYTVQADEELGPTTTDSQ
jgi:hypothetical protein